MICSSCNHYNNNLNYCRKFDMHNPSVESCMYYEDIKIPVQIYWGADKTTDDQWFLCSQCSTWWKQSQGHICNGVKVADPKSEDFINKDEMSLS